MWRETSDNKANLDTDKDELKFFKSVDIHSCEMCMFHGIVYQAATPFFVCFFITTIGDHLWIEKMIYTSSWKDLWGNC